VVDTLVADARPDGLAARAVGILTSPRATFARVVERPKAVTMLMLVAAVCAGTAAALMFTEVGRVALLDQQMRMLESFGVHPSAAQYAAMQRADGYAPYAMLAGQFLGLPAAALAISGVAFAAFSALGGTSRFGQTFAVVAYSGVIIAVQQLVVAPLAYLRESLSSPTSLAILVPFLDESSFASRLLGGIDLFYVWWIVTLAIGFGVLYKRRTAPIAAGLLLIYGGLAFVIAVVKSAAGA